MQLWCLFLVFLCFTSSKSMIYSNEPNNLLNNVETFEPNQLSIFTQEKRLIAKRSPRNANILYRYCRQSGQPPNFCLKYAVTMIFATGH